MITDEDSFKYFNMDVNLLIFSVRGVDSFYQDVKEIFSFTMCVGVNLSRCLVEGVLLLILVMLFSLGCDVMGKEDSVRWSSRSSNPRV